jgi:hypothetical protein
VGSRTVESVNVLAIVVAALGGGIVASLLESWMSSVRRFETARLLLYGELLGNEAVSRGAEAAPGRPFIGTLLEELTVTQRVKKVRALLPQSSDLLDGHDQSGHGGSCEAAYWKPQRLVLQ